jgi:hypothetical protein
MGGWRDALRTVLKKVVELVVKIGLLMTRYPVVGRMYLHGESGIVSMTQAGNC